MSTPLAYDPTLFSLQRSAGLPSLIGQFVIGQSALGVETTTWITVPGASVGITGGYSPDSNGTLLVDATTASVSISSWTDPGDLLLTGDRIRCSYDGAVLFEGIVDSFTITREADPEAATHGAAMRYTYTATATDSDWIAMQRVVYWLDALPEEPAIDRVRRFVGVTGWSY